MELRTFEIAKNYINMINKEMKISDIFEIEELSNELTEERRIKVNKLINAKLNSCEFKYNHKYLKNGNLLIYKDVAKTHVDKNII